MSASLRRDADRQRPTSPWASPAAGTRVASNEWNGYENIGKGPRTGQVYTVEVDVPALALSSAGVLESNSLHAEETQGR